MRAIPERDWKLSRSMKPRVLEDACARILKAVELAVQMRGRGNHEAYIALWDLLKKEDASIAFMFDDLKRSTGLFKLAAWRRHGLVSESDLALFSEETRNIIKAINENVG
jgi:hypothetical protein